ncbi:MAG TPA: type II secretion system protein [Gemmatimonadales bacterium]|nr:type II secretion system protein [Gemmatimonadales bacterium]
MIRRRRGFTIVELLTVMIVLGLLAGLALLKYLDFTHRARTAQVAGELEAVRLAAYGAWSENGTWPAEVGPGIIPPGLAPYLPGGFSFQHKEYTLDWENFVPPGGGPTAGMQLGVVLVSSNARLTKVLAQNLGNKAPFFVIGGSLTYVIIGPDGRS